MTGNLYTILTLDTLYHVQEIQVNLMSMHLCLVEQWINVREHK